MDQLAAHIARTAGPSGPNKVRPRSLRLLRFCPTSLMMFVSLTPTTTCRSTSTTSPLPFASSTRTRRTSTSRSSTVSSDSTTPTASTSQHHRSLRQQHLYRTALLLSRAPLVALEKRRTTHGPLVDRLRSSASTASRASSGSHPSPQAPVRARTVRGPAEAEPGLSCRSSPPLSSSTTSSSSRTGLAQCVQVLLAVYDRCAPH